MSSYIGTGYEAYGVDTDEEPRVKTLTQGSVEWPEAELTDGIFQILVKSYGDEPMSLFLAVYATSEQAAIDRWLMVRDSLAVTKKQWWL